MSKIDPARLPLATSDTPGIVNPVDIQNLIKVPMIQSALESKISANHNHDALYYTKTEVTDFLAAKADVGHSHEIDNITGLSLALSNKANRVHTHQTSDINGLLDAIDARIFGTWRGQTNGVASLSGGLIPTAQLPALAITSTYVKASQTDMLNIADASIGAVCILTNSSPIKSYILTGLPASSLSNWPTTPQPITPMLNMLPKPT